MDKHLAAGPSASPGRAVRGKGFFLTCLLLGVLLAACVTPTPSGTGSPENGVTPSEPPVQTTEPAPIPQTELPSTPAPSGCEFRPETVGEYAIWTLPGSPECNKGFAASISTKIQVSQVVDLPVENPQGNEEQFRLDRLVINFEVLDPQQAYMTAFDPPMRLYLAFTKAETETPETTNNLKFAFLDDNRVWVRLTPEKHGFTLVRQQPGADEKAFEFWDGSTWQPLKPEGDFYKIGDEQITIAELAFVNQSLRGFPGSAGFAFARVSGWGDRYIGAGH